MYNFDFSFVRSGAPIVTLSSTGIAFNSVVRNMLGYPSEIDIGYDEQSNAIGICAHNPENTDKPYEFESREKDGWVRISCRDFIRYLSQKNNMDFTKAIQFIPKYDTFAKMLIIIVDQTYMKTPKASETE